MLRYRRPRHHSYTVKLTGVGAFKPWVSALAIWHEATRNPAWSRAWARNSGCEVSGAEVGRNKLGFGEETEGSEPAVAVENCEPGVGFLDDDEALRGVETLAVNVECQIRKFAALIRDEGC